MVVIMFFFAFLHFLLLPKEMSYVIVLDVRFFSRLLEVMKYRQTLTEIKPFLPK